MIVVSDTSPLCYLLLIEGIEVLPQLFERVIIPQKVRDELLAPDAPKVVQEWISQPPDWLEVQTVTGQFDSALNPLDVGEQYHFLKYLPQIRSQECMPILSMM